jgi:hypothetical protein
MPPGRVTGRLVTVLVRRSEGGAPSARRFPRRVWGHRQERLGHSMLFRRSHLSFGVRTFDTCACALKGEGHGPVPTALLSLAVRSHESCEARQYMMAKRGVNRSSCLRAGALRARGQPLSMIKTGQGPAHCALRHDGEPLRSARGAPSGQAPGTRWSSSNRRVVFPLPAGPSKKRKLLLPAGTGQIRRCSYLHRVRPARSRPAGSDMPG